MDLRASLSKYELPAITMGAVCEDVARRVKKRQDAVAYVQCSTTYAKAIQNGYADVDRLQPDPDDITISKRKWESSFRTWRMSLRTMASEELSAGHQ